MYVRNISRLLGNCKLSTIFLLTSVTIHDRYATGIELYSEPSFLGEEGVIIQGVV